MTRCLFTLLALATPATALAQQELMIDISNRASWDLIDDPDNVVFTVPLAPGARVIGIGYDVTLETVGFSYLSDATILAEATDFSGGVFVTPGVEDNFPSLFTGPQDYTTDGLIDLVALDLDFTVAADGLLRVQFYETFDDAEDEIDANWLADSTLTVQWVPEPGPCGGLLLGLLLLRRR